MQKKNTLYVLRGVVGCGKSTYARELAQLAQKQQRYCIIEGSDKYYIRGVSLPLARANVTHALRAAMQSRAQGKIVILDTCGEGFNRQNVFGVDFSGWIIKEVWVNLDRQRLRQYLAWSLRNVVRRERDADVLTVGKATLPACIQVHLCKARAHFGVYTQAVAPHNCSLAALLEHLKKDANDYQQYLNENRSKYGAKEP